MVAIAGVGVLAFAAPTPVASGMNSSSSLSSDVHYNLTVRVGAIVEGKAIPIIGANVTVWSYSVNKTNDSVTITFTKVAKATTDSNGNVSFSLPVGKYIIVSTYSGLRSVVFVNLDKDVSGVVLLHNPARFCHGLKERLHATPIHSEGNETG